MSVVVMVVNSLQLDVSSSALELVTVTSVNVSVVLDIGDVLDLSTLDLGIAVASESLWIMELIKAGDCNALEEVLEDDIPLEESILIVEVLNPVDLAKLLLLPVSNVTDSEAGLVLLDTVTEEVDPIERSEGFTIAERRDDIVVV